MQIEGKLFEKSARSFYGAIVGSCPAYEGKAIALEEGQQMYFLMKDERVIATRYYEQGCLMSVAYTPIHNEYQVSVMEKCCIYLKSGQPLGAHRTYMLPRGTQVQVKDGEYRFLLA